MFFLHSIGLLVGQVYLVGLLCFFSGGDHVFLLLDFFLLLCLFLFFLLLSIGDIICTLQGVSDILFAVLVSDTFDLKIPVIRDPRQL